MFFEPLHDVGMLVGGIVVDDDMDRLFLGHSGLDEVQKPDELLMAMALHALANNLALKDIERLHRFRIRRFDGRRSPRGDAEIQGRGLAARVAPIAGSWGNLLSHSSR